jgi:hypothetical protein
VKSDIERLDKPGFVADQPDLALPLGAWTDSRNVQYRDGAAEKAKGYTQALGDLSVTAIWAAPVSDGTNFFWAYGANTVMYATDGTTHANITGSITLGATDDLNYSGGPFHGHLIVNDGVAIPQSWSPGLGNDLVSLTAWPAVTLTCKVMRSFKDFLFAFRITDSGSYNPRLLRHSDRANPGSLPLSWDFSDPTNQAGINELAQTQDAIVDGFPIRDSLMIYKENHSWIADYIGGDDIFGYRQVFSQVGMLTERCSVAFGSQHLVWTDQDIVLHDGNSAKSILDGRARRWLFNRINTNRYKRSFAVADYRERTAYFCFPESGQDWPTLALAWNWAEDTLYPYELGGPKTWADTGIIPNTDTTWANFPGTWATASRGWNEGVTSPFTGLMLFTDASAKRAYQGNTGETYNGTAMSVYAERTGITKDLKGIRRIKQIFPQVLGTTGDVLRFYVGVRAAQNSAVQWSGPYNFTIGTDYKIDLGRGRGISGRILDFRVEYSGTNTFRLHGIGIDHHADGLR